MRLVQLTKPKPVFSWHMPLARMGNASVNAFFHGPKESATLVIGGGIANARNCARQWSTFNNR